MSDASRPTPPKDPMHRPEMQGALERAVMNDSMKPWLLGHPKGLFVLFFVEMWERFSYYGMRALLVLYLIQRIDPEPSPGLFQDQIVNPGRGWTEPSAYMLYGWYTGLAYLLPIFGGFLADKILGTHRSMLLGGITIAIGHVILAISGMGAMEHSHAGMSLFIAGLAVIILGTGYFKPTVSVMVGQLYPEGDARRDGGFSIFYMGINVGAFICAFICGTLGEQVGWHYGFGAAAVGMIAGLLTYIAFRPVALRDVGNPPPGKPNLVIPLLLATLAVSGVVGLIYHGGGFHAIGGMFASALAHPVGGWALKIGLPLAVLAFVGWFTAIQKPGDKGPVFCIFVFILFNAFFWLAFEQAGSTLNVFARDNTQRMFGSWEMPASWFQSFNAFFIIAFAPIFAWLWVWLGKRKLNPNQPVKIALGLILLGLGYIVMVQGAEKAATGVKVSLMFLTLTYFLHTMGELCLSPTGLSFVTKAAPVRFVSFLMGFWFLSSFVANLGGGLIATTVPRIESGEIQLPWSDWFVDGSRAPFFMLFVVSSIGAGLVILLMTPILTKLLHGRG